MTSKKTLAKANRKNLFSLTYYLAKQEKNKLEKKEQRATKRALKEQALAEHKGHDHATLHNH